MKKNENWITTINTFALLVCLKYVLFLTLLLNSIEFFFFLNRIRELAQHCHLVESVYVY